MPTDTRPERPSRLYRLDITPATGGDTTTRLARAKTVPGAIAYVAGSVIVCRPATPDDAYELALAASAASAREIRLRLPHGAEREAEIAEAAAARAQRHPGAEG